MLGLASPKVGFVVSTESLRAFAVTALIIETGVPFTAVRCIGTQRLLGRAKLSRAGSLAALLFCARKTLAKLCACHIA